MLEETRRYGANEIRDAAIEVFLPAIGRAVGDLSHPDRKILWRTARNHNENYVIPLGETPEPIARIAVDLVALLGLCPRYLHDCYNPH